MFSLFNFDSYHLLRDDSNIYDYNISSIESIIDIKAENHSSPVFDNFINPVYNINIKDPLLLSQENINLKGYDSIINKNTNQLSEKENLNKIIFDKTSKEDIQKKIKEQILLKIPFNEKKKLGRKIKSKECLGGHNKFSDDNIQIKIKNVILKSLLKFINNKIKIVYSNLDEDSLNKMQLLKLKKKTKEVIKVDYYKKLLNRTLKSIFSEDISTKYKRYYKQHNSDLIEKLINEKDKTKKVIFNNLFNLTFADCLNHFRGSYLKEELNGMDQFDKYCEEIKSGNNIEMYKKVLKYYLENYEKEVTNKKTRKRNKGE